MTSQQPVRPVPSSNPVLANALKYGALLAAAIAVVMGVIGWFVAGGPGIVGALIGTAMALVFLGITAASILVTNRFIGSELYIGAFFGIVLGSWLLKFVLFIVLSIILKGQPWISPVILFISIVVGVIGSLSVDVLVVSRSRMPYASDVRIPTQASTSPNDARHAHADRSESGISGAENPTSYEP